MVERTSLNSVIAGSILMGLGVLFGAFGAHALERMIDTGSLSAFETAVRYQMYHGLALIFLGNRQKTYKIPYRFMLIGVILFSGSIYLLALDSLLGMDLSFLGILTPLGGTCLIIAWFATVYLLWREKSAK